MYETKREVNESQEEIFTSCDTRLKNDLNLLCVVPGLYSLQFKEKLF